MLTWQTIHWLGVETFSLLLEKAGRGKHQHVKSVKKVEIACGYMIMLTSPLMILFFLSHHNNSW